MTEVLKELEAELRRLAAQMKGHGDRTSGQTMSSYYGRKVAYTHAADLVRDAARGE